MREMFDDMKVPIILGILASLIVGVVIWGKVSFGLVFVFSILIGFFVINVMLWVWFGFVAGPRYRRELNALEYRIEGNSALLELMRYAKSNKIETLYVSRDLYNRLFSMNSALIEEPYYTYYADWRRITCRVYVDPNRDKFRFGSNRYKDCINTISDLYD